MADLYVGNPTKQHFTFWFRLPERADILKVQIPAGQQRPIVTDQTSDVVDYIVRQHERYGLKDVTEVSRAKEFANLVFSTSGPVPKKQMDMMYKANMGTLAMRGASLRRDTALITKQELESLDAGNVSVEITELDSRAPSGREASMSEVYGDDQSVMTRASRRKR